VKTKLGGYKVSEWKWLENEGMEWKWLESEDMEWKWLWNDSMSAEMI